MVDAAPSRADRDRAAARNRRGERGDQGPAASAPEQALEGFLRKTGLTKDQLEVRDLKGKPTWFAVVEKPGRAVKDVLAEAIPAIVRAFPWPKSQRWGAASISTESLRWVRPLSGIVAILGEDLVECEVGGIRSGYVTLGHRFHAPGEITIGGAHDYARKLSACHVIVDHVERQDLIRDEARNAAAAAGLTLVEDEGLVIENAGLTEWPVPLLGRFDEDFLEVPPETIQLTARVNQKYFVCEKDGKLADAFVCTANIEAADHGEAIVAGNRKVLAARLSDARFFWEQDRKTPLSEHAKKLERITFHEKLGTVADKVERVAKLARWLVEEGIVKPSPLQGRGLGEGLLPSLPSIPSPRPSPLKGRGRRLPIRQNSPHVCARPISSPRWSANSPNFRGLWAAITPAPKVCPMPSPTPSAITTSRSVRATASPPHRSAWPCRWRISWIRWLDFSSSRSVQPARVTRLPYDVQL